MKLFQQGRENVNNKPRSGCPSTSNTDEYIQKVKEIVLKDYRITIKEIADNLPINSNGCFGYGMSVSKNHSKIAQF